MEEQKFPTQKIELPSKGLIYPEDNPLSSGFIELKYPTAKEEDILTNTNLVNKGTAVKEFINSLIVDKSVKQNTMIMGDRNKMIFAGRIMAYGSQYVTEITCRNCGTSNEIELNLNEFEDVKIDETKLNRENEFDFALPNSKVNITYKILTVSDEDTIDTISKRLGKKFKGNTHENTNRLKQTIIAIEGDRDKSKIAEFIDLMPTKDTLALREEIRKNSPNIDLTLSYDCEQCSYEGEAQLPLGVGFFWPSARV